MLGSCFMSWFLNAYNYFVNLTVIPVKKNSYDDIALDVRILAQALLSHYYQYQLLSNFSNRWEFQLSSMRVKPQSLILVMKSHSPDGLHPFRSLCVYLYPYWSIFFFFFLWGGGTKHKSFIHITAGLPIIFPLAGLECNYLYWSIYAVLLTWLSCQ